MVSLFGKKKDEAREIELFQIKENMLSEKPKNNKPEQKQVSEKEKLMETIMKNISEYVEKESEKRLKEASIRARAEQIEADNKLHEIGRKAFRQGIFSIIDRKIKEAEKIQDGALVLFILGEIRREVEKI